MLLFTVGASAEDMYKSDRSRWMQIANETKPTLHFQTVKPVAIVKAVQDKDAFQGWRYEKTDKTVSNLQQKNFKDVKEVTLDFGHHLVGYFRFHTRTLNRVQDAPVRIKFFFGELPAELNTPLDPWRGSLSRAWMQDEVVTVTQTDKSWSNFLFIVLVWVNIHSKDTKFSACVCGWRWLKLVSGGGVSCRMTWTVSVFFLTLRQKLMAYEKEESDNR